MTNYSRPMYRPPTSFESQNGYATSVGFGDGGREQYGPSATPMQDQSTLAHPSYNADPGRRSPTGMRGGGGVQFHEQPDRPGYNVRPQRRLPWRRPLQRRGLTQAPKDNQKDNRARNIWAKEQRRQSLEDYRAQGLKTYHVPFRDRPEQWQDRYWQGQYETMTPRPTYESPSRSRIASPRRVAR